MPALALGLVLLLAACAELPPTGGSARPAAKPVAEAPTPQVTEPVAEPGAKPAPEAAKPAEETKVARAVPPSPAPAPRPSRPPLALKTLIGLDQGQARTLIGAPSAIVEQPPAVVWQYQGESCSLSLHFFLEVQKKNYRVLNLSIVGTDGTPTADQACLDGIRGKKMTQN